MKNNNCNWTMYGWTTTGQCNEKQQLHNCCEQMDSHFENNIVKQGKPRQATGNAEHNFTYTEFNYSIILYSQQEFSESFRNSCWAVWLMVYSLLWSQCLFWWWFTHDFGAEMSQKQPVWLFTHDGSTNKRTMELDTDNKVRNILNV